MLDLFLSGSYVVKIIACFTVKMNINPLLAINIKVKNSFDLNVISYKHLQFSLVSYLPEHNCYVSLNTLKHFINSYTETI